MKKHCLLFFHDWSEWNVDSDRRVDIYAYEWDRRPIRTERTIVQVRECQNCKKKEYKVTKMNV